MRLYITFLLFFLLNIQSIFAQPGFQPYHERTGFLHASPGSMKHGLYGYGNPAMPATLKEPDFLLHWGDDGDFTSINRWGFFAATPRYGFGQVTYLENNLRLTDYRISFAYGDDKVKAGFGYGWYRGSEELLESSNLGNSLSFGFLVRPVKYLSFGMFGTRSLQEQQSEGVVEAGIRPFGNEWLTLYGDYAVSTTMEFDEGTWSAGLAIEPLPGLRLTSRYMSESFITAGIQLSLGRAGVSYQANLDHDGNHQFNSYGIRSGAYDRNIKDKYFVEDNTYIDLQLSGGLRYQPESRLFGNDRTLYVILDELEEARNDPSVAGVIVDATNLRINLFMIWEIKEQLRKLREEGKMVILYIETGGMNTLHLIAEADKVIMDPQGGLTIPGYVLGSTYLNELLESVGIGVDEFRLMEYKSGIEQFSRTEMSEAEKEQRQSIIDGFYDLTKGDVSRGRDINPDTYDSLIDRGVFLLPSELINAGIIDTLVRKDDLNDLLGEFHEGSFNRRASNSLNIYSLPDDNYWGPKPKIALLYAVGATVTEGGIRARVLAQEIKKHRQDPQVKAIIMRVESPGGSALASDLVAGELKKASEEKPVIVTQGGLAASGGYWISMNADTIMALPHTLTGSIGVASMWLYDAGLKEKLKLHTDHLQRGASADLFFGPSLPLVGIGLPGRNLTEAEREQAIEMIMHLYEDFVQNVADARNTNYDAIREVAEGRVWTGLQAKENGLVDEIGNLTDALHLAVHMAGLDPDEKFEVVEGPEPPYFSLSALMSQLMNTSTPAVNSEQNPVKEYLEMLIDHNGEPLLVMPFDFFQLYYKNTQ